MIFFFSPSSGESFVHVMFFSMEERDLNDLNWFDKNKMETLDLNDLNLFNKK